MWLEPLHGQGFWTQYQEKKGSEHEHYLRFLTVVTAQSATFGPCCHAFLTMMGNTLKLPVGRNSPFPKLLMPGILDHQQEK